MLTGSVPRRTEANPGPEGVWPRPVDLSACTTAFRGGPQRGPRLRPGAPDARNGRPQGGLDAEGSGSLRDQEEGSECRTQPLPPPPATEARPLLDAGPGTAAWHALHSEVTAHAREWAAACSGGRGTGHPVPTGQRVLAVCTQSALGLRRRKPPPPFSSNPAPPHLTDTPQGHHVPAAASPSQASPGQ